MIGWNKIQRRNLGFLYAYEQGADVVATVDDDNIPYENWGEDLYVGQEIECDLWQPENGYFDPLSVTNHCDLWHRGYPIEHLPTKNNVTYQGKTKRKVLIQADLWDGDPDIDAMCRISKQPCVKFEKLSPYCSDAPSPFNSQNTFIHHDVIPFYMVLPYIGRMDDIWGSYILQYYFPNSVIYNKASVYQDRNVQDLVTNLEKEVIGYRNTYDFINNLKKYMDNLPEDARHFYKTYMKAYK